MSQYKKVHCHITRSTNVFDAKIEPFRNQSFDEIKRHCLRRKQLFEDPEFPANYQSVFYKTRQSYEIHWKRPHELIKAPLTPKFIVNTASANDLHQGTIGNCWFIAGCAAIAQQPELIAKIIPHDQSFDEGDYAGIFHFRFWIYGTWYDVVIDDRLPVRREGSLLFCRNKREPDEFWGALIEKAYAKVYGSYESLDGGITADALVDLTGGIEETFTIRDMQTDEKKNEIWEIIKKSRLLMSLNAAFIEPDSVRKEFRLYNGLVMGHAYTITNIAVVNYRGKDVRLIRMRNPWGNDIEWKGPWSDTSEEWDRISDHVKQSIDFKVAKEGEFWMDFNDFYRNFHALQFCSLTPDAFSEELLDANSRTKHSWKMVAYHGQWIRGISAGGCGQNNQALYWTNPQFLVTLADMDFGDRENKCTIIVSLMQKHIRENRMKKMTDSLGEFIQFRLYRIKNHKDAERAKRTGEKLYASELEQCGDSEAYVNRREVTRRFRESPGDYLLIPSCFDSGHEGDFLLRVFTEKPIENTNAQILSEDKKNLTDSDIFFEHADTSKDFEKWCNLLSPAAEINLPIPNKPGFVKRKVEICVRSEAASTPLSSIHDTIYITGSTRFVKDQTVDQACVTM